MFSLVSATRRSRATLVIAATCAGILLAMMLAQVSADPYGGPEAASPTDAPATYIVIAWNDLGMHCYNQDYQDMAILPPYNTVWAQVIKVGDPPQIVTSGVTVEYRILDNTHSAGKTNFWSYAEKLFGVKLAPNVGLKGKGLAGLMDPAGDHFIAEGIPLTEYTDYDKRFTKPQPFQQIRVTVRDSTTKKELATITAVAPVSSELHCDNCHADGADATSAITPTGRVATNILTVHDLRSKAKYPAGHTTALMDRRPVLCAECHGDNALGKPGLAGVRSLSKSMHMQHNGLPDITPDTDGCYNCHPGPRTQCLRDTMSQSFGLGCVDCHGTIHQVSTNPNQWLNEPKCSTSSCHGAGYQTAQPLYRNSKGHGGMYCAACHDSPHAIAQSRETTDDAKFRQLQGSLGTLRKCVVCHGTKPDGMFKHD